MLVPKIRKYIQVIKRFYRVLANKKKTAALRGSNSRMNKSGIRYKSNFNPKLQFDH